MAIRGLQRTRYIDQVDGMREKTSDDAPITPAGEIDRVFVDTTTACLVEDPGLARACRPERVTR